MRFIIAVGGLGFLLLLGLLLRVRSRALQRLFLPVPVIAGFIGLALGPYALDTVPSDVVAIWAAMPGILINFVFAALFLGVTIPSVGRLMALGGPLFRFGTVVALGQYVVAILLTVLVLTPVFGTPLLFACLLEVGFAGGHGTAAAMGPVFDDLGFEAGAALAQMSATVGIVVAVVSGMALVQHGVRRGHTTQLKLEAGEDSLEVKSEGVLPVSQRRSIATATVSPGVMEPLTLHLAVTAAAVLIGWVMLQGIRAVHPSLAGFPLFPLAMVGGMLVQLLADRTGAATVFDRHTFERILGVSLDLLVVAAIASLRLDLFWQNVVPFTLLMAVGVVWVLFAFLVIAPRMIRKYWFEQALTEYGMTTGVTAVGLMLLRVVDPETKTPAAQAFAAKQMVFSPLMGGGLVTATVPLLLLGMGWVPVVAGVLGLMVVAYVWPTRA